MRKTIKNWEEIFEKHQQSGKSIPAFCDEIGIHPNTFYKLRKNKASMVVEIKPTRSIAVTPILLRG